MSKGLSCQLHVSLKHSQGSFRCYHVKAHVHQLGENTGRWRPLQRPGLPELAHTPHSCPPVSSRDASSSRKHVYKTPHSCTTGLLYTPLANTNVQMTSLGSTEEGWHQCASALSSQKGTGSWAQQSALPTSLPEPLTTRPQGTRCPHVKGTNVDQEAPVLCSSCSPSTFSNCWCVAGPWDGPTSHQEPREPRWTQPRPSHPRPDRWKGTDDSHSLGQCFPGKGFLDGCGFQDRSD